MSRTHAVPTFRTKRIATLIALAAAGGTLAVAGAQAEAETTAVEEDSSSYRVCHYTGDSSQPFDASKPYELQVYDSGGDMRRDHELHAFDIELKEDGESCPDPVTPRSEEPPVVIEAVSQPQAQAPAAAPQPQLVRSRAPRVCASRRDFRIRVRTRKADPVVKAVVRVNGRKVRVVRGARLTAPVRLTGLPKGRYAVDITATTRSGRQLSGVRRYFTCTPKSARRTVPQH